VGFNSHAQEPTTLLARCKENCSANTGAGTTLSATKSSAPCRWTIGPAPLAAVPGQSRAGEGFTPSTPHSGSPRVLRGGLVPSPRCTMATRPGVATLVR
jgi:hypothetical protein